MSNIIKFPTKDGDFNLRDTAARVQQYADMPAHITRNASLNKRIMRLQDAGFGIHRDAAGGILFTHPNVGYPLSFCEACQCDNEWRSVQA